MTSIEETYSEGIGSEQHPVTKSILSRDLRQEAAWLKSVYFRHPFRSIHNIKHNLFNLNVLPKVDKSPLNFLISNSNIVVLKEK